MRVLIVQPPRMYWPYTSEGDNFLLQQALPALAGALRAEPGVEVIVLDCMPLHIGWKSLADEIKRLDPDVIGCGENHALYASEALRFFRLCKEVAPRAKTVAGGGHFTNLAHRYLKAGSDIDFVCIGEGEVTIVELVRELAKTNPDLSRVDGVAWFNGEELVRNKPRQLVKDLDTIPLPAYDLMPMELYGRSRYLFSPGGTTIHHSRGCVSKCSFCAWWTTMADRKYDEDGNAQLRPRWRSKSVGRVFEELELLYWKHGKRGYVWVDESWNIDPHFNDEFAETMLRSGMQTKWFAFMRADCIVRDEKSGILEKLIRAGLSHILIGVERAEDDALTLLDKRFYTKGVARQALEIFKRRYPEVFVQATFIVGVKEESKETLQRQLDMAKSLDVDFPAFHPITPVPGTPIYDEAIANGHITEADFDNFDWLTPVLDSQYMTKDEIAEEIWRLNRELVNNRWLAKGLLSRVPYKRDMYLWFTKVSAAMAVDAVKRRISPLNVEHYQQLVKPEWYDR
ncbi:MAG: cobalamin-dependent protein [Deltaproteobacteria bacterium]|jgi:anaerobic magnesium-protoporphyrin IX monomethyl ester cyclase|nr:cobalamin-dependent protein [Deltaproteobacteria bacterium]